MAYYFLDYLTGNMRRVRILSNMHLDLYTLCVNWQRSVISSLCLQIKITHKLQCSFSKNCISKISNLFPNNLYYALLSDFWGSSCSRQSLYVWYNFVCRYTIMYILVISVCIKYYTWVTHINPMNQNNNYSYK